MSIRVEHVSKRFGSFVAVDDVGFELPTGSLAALLGPSGSGKSTLLRILAGLESPDHGSVWLDGTEATALHARDRSVGFVFQSYALFRHLTVEENVAFGLRVQRVPRRVMSARAREVLDLVGLDGLGERYPAQLSGGQRQRVALARALAPEPRLLLLDEPFGAIDAKVRDELRRWLRRLHDDVGVTSLFVTHDQEEALSVADQVLVFHEGRLEQVGTPRQIQDAPATAFVASFVGEVNVFAAEVHGDRARCGALEARLTGARPGPVQLFVRSHDVTLRPDLVGIATVHRVVPLGDRVQVDCAVDGAGPLVVRMARGPAADALAPGARVHVDVAAARAYPPGSAP